MPDTLKEKAAGLPDRPGVYLFKDDRGRVLYVGKAKSLRHRVAQYFHAQPDRDPKTTALLRHVADLEVLEMESEVEALLAEARLVKDIQPKYNVNLKDGKSFPLLAISKGDDFPTVYVTRERNPERATYYGPFTDPAGLREALGLMQRIFQFRTCDLAIVAGDPKNRRYRPCILHSIGQCTAPCADRIGKRAYRQDLRALRRVLAGGKRDLMADLRRRMNAAAARLEYEAAAKLRDQIRALESLDRRGHAADAWMPGGFGAAPGRDGPLTPVDPRAAVEDLQRILGLPAPPRTIEGVDAANLHGEEAVGSLVAFVDGIPFKDGYRRYRIQGDKGAPQQSGAGNSVTAPHAAGLPRSARRGAEGAHAALLRGGDDFAMIREVVTRRFARLATEGEVFPQVLLIDGGIGQLRAAAEALEELKVEPMPVVLALAKKEETLYRWRRPGTVQAARRDLGLRLLMAVRDEAHRFAQRYHHVLRKKKTLGR